MVKTLRTTIQQRQHEFNQLFGPLDVWFLLPFKKLKSFWNKIVKRTKTERITNTSEPVIRTLSVKSFVTKFVQGLFPV